MIKRLLAIGFIFGCTSIAWAILGSTVFARTYMSDSDLKSRVERIWGSAQTQYPPSASYTLDKTREEESTIKGEKVVKLVKYQQTIDVPLLASDAQVDLGLDYRQKGLLWYSTYRAAFSGSYRFRNDSGQDRSLHVTFPFPSQSANYDDFRFTVQNGRWQNHPEARNGQIVGVVWVRAGDTATVDVGYRNAQGLDSWRYRFAAKDDNQGVAEIRDFRLVMRTDFDAIDFPDDGISPTLKEQADAGWKLTWQYSNLITGVDLGMLMPQKLQPGPLAGQISLFAPVSLFFFIVVMLAISLMRGIELHAMHFFFLSAAFFSFHLLLAYLVDHVSIHFAFLAASVVSVGLVVSYLRVAIGSRFAYVEAALAQIVYLVLFSYAFFFKGYTGLAVTIGAILTLFVLMQMTARLRWSDIFARRAQT